MEPLACPGGVGQDRRLSRSLGVCLLAVFASEAFVYTIVDPYLPEVYQELAGWTMAAVFSTYCTMQLLATVVVLLLQLLPRVAAAPPSYDGFIFITAFAGFTASTVPCVMWPTSAAAVAAQRAALGTTCSLLFVYAYRGVVRGLDPQEALKAVAVINAGLVLGDSVAPIIGHVAFAESGVFMASAVQVMVCGAALLLLLVLVCADMACTAAASNSRSCAGAGAGTKCGSTHMGSSSAVVNTHSKHHCSSAATEASSSNVSFTSMTWDMMYSSSGQPCAVQTNSNEHQQQHQVQHHASNKSAGGTSSGLSTAGIVLLRAQSRRTHNSLPGTKTVALQPAMSLDPVQDKYAAQLAAASAAGGDSVAGLESTFAETDHHDQAQLLLRFVKHWAVTRQLLMLVMTQGVRCMLTIVMPFTLAGAPVWVVPTLFAVQAVFAAGSPFLLETALAAGVKWLNTAVMMSLLSLLLAASSATLLPVANLVAPGGVVQPGFLVLVVVLCALGGASYATLEVLIFHHSSVIAAQSGSHLSMDLGAVMYTLYYCLGNWLGGIIGGLVVHASGFTPVLTTAAVATGLCLYGQGLACASRKLCSAMHTGSMVTPSVGSIPISTLSGAAARAVVLSASGGRAAFLMSVSNSGMAGSRPPTNHGGKAADGFMLSLGGSRLHHQGLPTSSTALARHGSGIHSAIGSIPVPPHAGAASLDLPTSNDTCAGLAV